MALDVVVSRCGLVLVLARMEEPRFCPICREPLSTIARDMAIEEAVIAAGTDTALAAQLETQVNDDLLTTTTVNAYGLQETT